jgi:[protein-PII] uridylyltransferase
MLRSASVREVSLRERRDSLEARADLDGAEFCRQYALAADEWLIEIAQRAAGTAPHHLALLAVGGYGRGELCPYSDLDLVLVHEGHGDVATVADAIWYPVWDEGVHLDHSVRRPKEVLAMARADLRVALGLLDARTVWGDRAVGEPLVAAARTQWREIQGVSSLDELAHQVEARRGAHGDLAFLLEPDLKEAHGGLRDVDALRAVAMCAPAVAEQVDLAGLSAARRVLLEARVALHRAAGRRLDRLVLQEQDQVATALGYRDADALMAAISAAGRSIAWTSDGAWRRRDRWDPSRRSPARQVPRWSRRLRRDVTTAGAPGTRAHAGTSLARIAPPAAPSRDLVVVEPPIALSETEAVLVGEPSSTGQSGARVPVGVAAPLDASIALRLAAVAAERRVPIARRSLQALARSMAAPPDPWPADTRDALVRLLCHGRAALESLEALDQTGLFVRLLPEWALVRNKPQRNAYHRFTVDRHLLEAAANAAALTHRVSRPELLVIGALLHDIGKGEPGDHTAAGVVLVERIARRMGFAPRDVDTLVRLCRLHLLLPDTATRRDLEDPRTIELTASAVGDSATLRLLWALTEADALATGPAAWGGWKAGLVAELVERTDRFLAGHLPAERDDGRPARPNLDETVDEMVAQVRASGQPVVELRAPQVLFAAPDRRGLLASVAGVLALHGLDVRSADAFGAEGVAVEEFSVAPARGTWPDVERLRADLVAVLSGELDLGRRLAAKADAYAGARRPSIASPVEPTVAIDTSASVSSTVIDVRTSDEVGLLHRMTEALFDCGLDVVSARVSTSGDTVVDAFYVRDASGAKVTDPVALARVERTLLEALR